MEYEIGARLDRLELALQEIGGMVNEIHMKHYPEKHKQKE